MQGLLWRVLIAAIAVALALALIPLLFQLVGYSNGVLVRIVQLCVVGIAIFYVVDGRSAW